MKQTHLVAVLLLTVVTAGCVGPRYPDALTQDNINQTADAVANSESATLEVKITGDRTNQRLLVEYNKTTQEALFTRYVDGERVKQRYITNDKEYEWNNGSPTFDEREKSLVPPADDRVAQILASTITLNEPVEKTGTTTYNGNTVGVYEATGERVANITGGSVGQQAAGNATVTLYATNDGRVVYAEYETEQGTVTASVTDLNETTVDSPSWILESQREDSDAPPRMGTTLSAGTDNETLTVTVNDPGNVDSFTVQSGGSVLQTVDGNAARVVSPTEGTTLTIDLSTDDYDARGDLILVVAENEGIEGVVAQRTAPNDT